MAEIVRKQDNPHYIDTFEGKYSDTEVNLLEVCKRIFEESDILCVEDRPVTSDRANPNTLSLSAEDLPGLFIWCDGSDPDIQTMGQNRGSRTNGYESFFTTVKYIHSSVDVSQGSKDIKRVAYELRKQILENLNLNGVHNGPSELVDVNLQPDLQIISDSITPVNCVTIRVLYKSTFRQKNARHK